MKKVVLKLKELGKTIATMESCTGGAIVNQITNIEGASDVLRFSAVTYSNEYKVKMGVKQETIDTYSVYSMETAKEMSRTICEFTGADYGIGVTGKLNRVDEHNLFGKDNIVFVSIYDKEKDTFFEIVVEASLKSRSLNKELVVNKVVTKLHSILSCDD